MNHLCNIGHNGPFFSVQKSSLKKKKKEKKNIPYPNVWDPPSLHFLSQPF